MDSKTLQESSRSGGGTSSDMPPIPMLALIARITAARQTAQIISFPLTCSASLDFDLLAGLATLRAKAFYLLHDVHALAHFAEDDVLAIEPVRLHCAQEKLGAIRVWAGVRHREHARALMLQLKIFVGELVAVDGLAARAVVVGEVATLAHEVGNDAVEAAAREAKALLPGAKRAEVLGGLGDLFIVQIHHDPAE
eukprot:CAMPEP_0119368368 /NCGR_PEP_ID=MMETSP1334-20130426/15028_1 /TAXON_ID=127549 /ORGANISM="Calcidiscus leptoporus, Strain RCC1130" /LENGTH=194 /DNA_ID=CAMNT_0007384993 /DNA_START=272 /DNA_END=856 /DNA_ORIENTATION=-